MKVGETVRAVIDVVEFGFLEPDEKFIHAQGGDHGVIVARGDGGSYLVQFGDTIAEVFPEDVKPLAPAGLGASPAS